MTDPQERDIAKTLRQELARVNEAIVTLKKEPRPQELEGFGDNTPLSEEIDTISTAEREEMRADRLSRLLDRAAALDEAIHRVDLRTYGTCVSCDKKISEERLSAVPEAARCANCQSDEERWQPTEEPLPKEWLVGRGDAARA